MSHLFKEYGPKRGEIVTRQNGVLVSMETGDATGFAINNIQERGRLFISPGDAIYAGMVVGENSRPDDMAVNPCKAKALTNMRSQGDGKGIQLDTPITMSLERALEYIGPDEFVEATPTSLRMRKKILDENKRRRAESKA
jgi:GTP-binding protein